MGAVARVIAVAAALAVGQLTLLVVRRRRRARSDPAARLRAARRAARQIARDSRRRGRGSIRSKGMEAATPSPSTPLLE